MVHFLNCMTFCVKVPVLSEKMYSIWPSCSFRVVVRACTGKRADWMECLDLDGLKSEESELEQLFSSQDPLTSLYWNFKLHPIVFISKCTSVVITCTQYWILVAWLQKTEYTETLNLLMNTQRYSKSPENSHQVDCEFWFFWQSRVKKRFFYWFSQLEGKNKLLIMKWTFL